MFDPPQPPRTRTPALMPTTCSESRLVSRSHVWTDGRSRRFLLFRLRPFRRSLKIAGKKDTPARLSRHVLRGRITRVRMEVEGRRGQSRQWVHSDRTTRQWGYATSSSWACDPGRQQLPGTCVRDGQAGMRVTGITPITALWGLRMWAMWRTASRADGPAAVTAAQPGFGPSSTS